jgi:hypothetical protein
MKKGLFLAVAAVVGVASAYASMRTTFVYINRAESGVYEKLPSTTPLDPSKCITATTLPCDYITTVDRGASTSQTQLISDGAVQQNLNKKSLQ